MARTDVIVDDRAGSIELANALDHQGLPIHVGRLRFGDIGFMGLDGHGRRMSVGVEFKRFGELVAAMRSGRLTGHQAPGLTKKYDRGYVLIEGQPEWYAATGLLMSRVSARDFRPMHGHMTIGEYLGRLMDLHRYYGLIPWQTASRRETLQWIVALYKHTTRAPDVVSQATVYRPPSLLPITSFVKIVSGLPGISYVLARRFEERFATPRQFFASTAKDWQQVEGIGPKIARKIEQCIDRREHS